MSNDVEEDKESVEVTGAPTEIWLCYGEIEKTQSHAEILRNAEVLWCEDSQEHTDVRYVRADALEAKDKRIAELEAENARLRVDSERIDWIESMILKHAGVWFAPCGEELRFVQLRWVGNKDSVENFPTVNGIRAAIDAAKESNGQQVKG